jgi:signal transduction histidine kinase
LEQSVHTRNELHAQRDLLRHLEQALLAPTLHTTLQRLLGGVATSSHAIAATLLLPVELSYALGLQQIAADVPVARHDEQDALVVAVARWNHSDYPRAGIEPCGFDIQSLAPATSRAGAVFPCVHEDEPVGWVALQYATDQPLHVVDPASLRQVMAVVTAVLVWLREQVQREQQAQQSVRMLVQHAHQQRSSAITDLMAGLAHELNNPLSSVLGLAALLQRDPTISNDTRADVEAISAETNRIHEFVKRLSSFGQLTNSTKVPVKLNEVIGDALTVLNGLAQQRNVAINCTLAEESPVVLGNRAQLQQVCLDLLSNALEALETSDAPEIKVDVHAEGEWAVLRVVDNGYGIPEDVRDRIWMPGFTTKTTGGTRRGLGIGLPMALDIVRQHWGTISVTSQIWQGSCFTIRLPLI